MYKRTLQLNFVIINSLMEQLQSVCTCLSIGFSMQRALTVSEYIFPTELGCLVSFRSGTSC